MADAPAGLAPDSLEWAKHRDETRLREAELALRREELALKRAEAEAARGSSRSLLNPAVATVLVAIVGGASGAIGSAITGYMNRGTEERKGLTLVGVESEKSKALVEIERVKVDGNLDLEREKQKAAERLARNEFETKLIFRAIEGATEEEQTRNLLFFLKAGFITDQEGKIGSLKPSEFPTKSSGTASVFKLKDPAACEAFARSDLKATARPATAADVEAVAAETGIDPAFLKAVLEVEMLPSGFRDGRIAFTFYPTFFHRYTAGQHAEANPDISAPTFSQARPTRDLERLKRAMALDCGAALAATGWGRMDVTGALFRNAGYESVDEFVQSQMESERKQIAAGAAVFRSPGLVKALGDGDWIGVTRRVRGRPDSDLAKRLAEAYARHGGKPR